MTLTNLYLRIVLFLLVIPVISFAGQFKCINVIDGDTIKVSDNDTEIIIRLVGIDAPEISKETQSEQPFSKWATKILTELVLNKTVEIETYGIDRYGNTLGVVYIDGRNINLKMLKVGLAEVYKGDLSKDFNLKPYQWEESEAKKAGRGMWILGDKYVSPREWRKMQ
jgi:endonuclease YncB( thermonuclease family)